MSPQSTIQKMKQKLKIKQVSHHYKQFDMEKIAENKIYLKDGTVYMIYTINSPNIVFFDNVQQAKMVELLRNAFIEVDDFSLLNKSIKDDVSFEINNFKKLFKQTDKKELQSLQKLRIEELENVQSSNNHRLNQTFFMVQVKVKDIEHAEAIVLKFYKRYDVKKLTNIQTSQIAYNLLNFEEIETDITSWHMSTYYQLNIKEDVTYLKTDEGKYVQFLVARDFKSQYTNNGFLNELMFDENIYYSKLNVKKVEDYEADEVLSTSLDNLVERYDETRRPSLKKKIGSDVKTMEQIVVDTYEGKEHLILIEMYFCIVADSLKELNEKRTAFIKTLKKQSISVTTSHWEQRKFFMNILTSKVDTFAVAPVVKSLAGGYPVASSTLKQKGGGFVGITKNKQAVIMSFIKDNLFRSWNMIVFGRSRSGKSSSIKVLIELLVGFFFHFLIIDPNDEYIGLAKYFGGNVISPNDMKINVHDLMMNISDIEQRVSLLDKNLNRILLFYKSYNHNLTDAEVGIIKQLTFKAYAKKGITRSTTFEDVKNLQMPIISDVYDEFKIYKEERLLNVSQIELNAFFNLEQMFESLTTGEENELFNNYTSNTVNISHFTVFAIKSLLNDQLLFNPYMYLVENFIENRVYMNKIRGIKTIEVVDEGHRMLDEKNPDIAKRLAQSAKEFGKFEAGLWFITQNSADVFKVSKEITKHALAIMSNSTYLFLMNMSDEDLTLLNEKTGNRLLTETDIEYVRNADVRETLLYVNNTIPYRFTFTPNDQSFKHYGGA